MKKHIAIVSLTGLMLVGCGQLDTYLEDRLSTVNAEAYDAWLRAAEEQEVRIADQEDAIVELAKQVKQQASEGNLEGARLALVELDLKQKQYGQLVKEYNDVKDQADAILKQQVDMPVRGVLGLLDPLVPIPLQPLVPIASSLVVVLLSKRSRKHALNGLKGLAKGNLAELGGYLLKAVGAAHTSAQTKQVAELEEKGAHVKVQAEEGAEP
jgi:uncharacterized coiled-coil protein SlyX